MGRKMIIYRNEEYMTLGGESRSFPAEAAEKIFHDYVKERVMELLNVSADEAEAMMEDGCEEGVCYNQADGYASIRFGSDVWEHLAVVDIPDDDDEYKWKDLGHCRFVSADQRMEIRACHNKSGYFWRLKDRLTGRTKDLSVLDICKAGGQLWAKESREKRMYNSVLSARLLFNNDEEVVRRAKVYLAAKNVHGLLGIDTSFETVTEMMSSLFPGVYGVDLTGLSTTTGYCKQYLGDISVTCDWFWTAQGLYDAIKPALLEGSSLQLFSDQA